MCYIFFGGYCLGDAITSFKNGKYRAFGYNTMFVIATILQMIALVTL